MNSEPGRSLIVWTIRLSVALYAWCLWHRLQERNDLKSGQTSDCWLWAASWLLCVIHVAFAFHFQHRWSHSDALQHTADVTASVTGLHWSIGLYVNYVFVIAWGVDVFRRLVHQKSSTALWFHAVAAFMIFNATAVFGPRFWIPVTIIYIAGLIWKTQSGRVTSG